MHEAEHRGPGGSVPAEELDHHLVDYKKIITVLAVDMVGSTRHIAACDPDEAQYVVPGNDDGAEHAWHLH